MQLAEFQIDGLFDHLNHHIHFPTSTESPSGPSVTILHGPNGIGKTTILRMIDGLMKLDFNVFREIPFRAARLKFSTGQAISVQSEVIGDSSALVVRFAQHTVRLHPQQQGALSDDERPAVELFRTEFFQATESLKFDFINTARMLGTANKEEELEWVNYERVVAGEGRVFRNLLAHPTRKRKVEATRSLSARVQQFIREAQANYRRFFATSQPDLFPKVLERLADDTPREVQPSELLQRLRRIDASDKAAKHFGLEPEPWDLSKLEKFLNAKQGASNDQLLTVLSIYVEALESRVAERELVAERLRNFERLMKEFFEDKSVHVSASHGLQIVTESGKPLSEEQLSSGEYRLLYLMVMALVTQRRGSVIAIDEPEMSMHLKWQRSLVRALVECASKAQPQFVFATHSPDIAAEYRDYLVALSSSEAETVAQ